MWFQINNRAETSIATLPEVLTDHVAKLETFLCGKLQFDLFIPYISPSLTCLLLMTANKSSPTGPTTLSSSIPIGEEDVVHYTLLQWLLVYGEPAACLALPWEHFGENTL